MTSDLIKVLALGLFRRANAEKLWETSICVPVGLKVFSLDFPVCFYFTVTCYPYLSPVTCTRFEVVSLGLRKIFEWERLTHDKFWLF